MASRLNLQALDAGLRAAEPDLSIPLLRTLVAVSLNAHLSVSDLAELIRVPQQTASRYVAILQGRYQASENTSSFTRRPLLTHIASATDLRRYELALTSHGVSRLNSISDRIFSKGPFE